MTLATSMVLARLLTPEEIGVFSVTMVFLGIVATVRDVGAGQYIVREPNLTEDGVRATRTIQVSIGLALAVLTFLTARPLAAFYESEEITAIMHILAANFAVIPFGAVMVAVWTRELQFQKIAAMRFSGAIAGSATGISLAYLGHGAVSLAWSALATQLTGVAVASLLWQGRFTLMPGLREIGKVFAFGGRVTAYSVIRSVMEGIPEMFLARLQGMTATGLLSRGHGLVLLFDRLVMDAVGSVVFPVFSKTMREGGDLTQTYMRVLAMVTVLGWSFFAILAVSAFPVIRILFGNQWDGAVSITRILCLAFAIQLPLRLTVTLLVTKGAIGLVVRTALISLIVTAVLCLIGASYGLHELGWGLVIANLVNLGLWMHTAHREICFALAPMFRLTTVSLLIGAAAAAPFLAVAQLFRFDGDLEDLFLLIPAGVMAMLLFIMLARRTRHAINSEIEHAVNAASALVKRSMKR